MDLDQILYSGSPNSYRYQRVFGELHFRRCFRCFLLKKELNGRKSWCIPKTSKDDRYNKTFPLLQQAEQYRVRATEKEYKAAKKALDVTVNDFEKKAPQAVAEVVNSSSSVAEPEQSELKTNPKNPQRIWN